MNTHTIRCGSCHNCTEVEQARQVFLSEPIIHNGRRDATHFNKVNKDHPCEEWSEKQLHNHI